MRRWILSLGTVLVLAALGYAIVHKAQALRPAYVPTSAQAAELRALGIEAIRSGDVPVAALLLYRDTVIGRGFNTVLRDANAAGHAEVNAVNDALRTLGRDRFARLDRDSLLLLSTFEPCAMCRGMMQEDRILHMAFIKPKTLHHWIGQDLRALRTDLDARTSAPEGLQDSLFRMHPAYDPATDR